MTKRRRCTAVPDGIAYLSGKRTEHEKCEFCSLEGLMYINSFFACCAINNMEKELV